MTITDKIENLKTGYDMSYRNKYTKWVAAMFAAVLMFLPGCIKESPVDDYLPAGSTVLRISTKGIAVSDAPGTDYEVYVKTLRLIGFQEGNKVLDAVINFEDESVMEKYPVLGTGEKAYIEIPLKDLGATIKRGTLDLYAVANEEAAWTDENNPFRNIKQDDLKNLSVAAEDSYPAPRADNPFLMSAHVNTTLVAQKNEIDIKLVRTVGKVMLKSVKMADGTPLNGYTYTLGASGSVYASYPLFEGTAGQGTKDVTISPEVAPFYISESGNTVDITVTVTYDGTQYSGTLNSQQITRNHCLQINGIITKEEEVPCLQFDVTVLPWTEQEIDVSYE